MIGLDTSNNRKFNHFRHFLAGCRQPYDFSNQHFRTQVEAEILLDTKFVCQLQVVREISLFENHAFS